MSRFYIYGLIPPVKGGTNGARWNGWACPYFTKDSADAIVAAWIAEYGTFTERDAERPSAYYDDATRTYCFYDPTSDQRETFTPHTIDGVEVWSIGAWGWTWECEDDAQGGDLGFPREVQS
jgi:hypothetical protein